MNDSDLIRQLSEEQIRMKEKIHTIMDRLDEQKSLLTSINDLTSSVKLLTVQMAETKDRIKALSNDVSDLKYKPGKRIENIISAAVSAVVAGLVAYVMVKLGLK